MTRRRWNLGLPPAVVLSCCLGLCAVVEGQTCPTSTAVYLDDTATCNDSTPDALRAYGARIWGDVLLGDDGNELRVYFLADPAHPALTQTTSFSVPPVGDIDWMLVQAAVNPASTYGVATWRTATGLWRWDAGRITDRRIVSQRGGHPGVVYVSGGASYLLSSDVHTEAGAWALRLDSTSSLAPVQRVSGASVSGGVQVGSTLYVVQTLGLATTLQVYAIGADGMLTPGPNLGTATGGYSLGVAVSGDRMVTTTGSVVRLWDVSAPLAPRQVHEITARANIAGVDGLLAVTARTGERGSERVWSLAGDHLTDVTPAWFAGRWTEHTECVVPRGIALRGGRLYYAQGAVAEAIDLRCLVPSPPTPPPAAIFADGFESGGMTAWH